MTPRDDAELFWERHYSTRLARGEHANPLLVETAEPLPPGAALDLGCGAGGDTIWLAQHGWQVTAVDIASTAVERVRARARDLGVDSRVTAEPHDLARSFPGGTFDLVSAQYLHTPFPFPAAGCCASPRGPCVPAVCSWSSTTVPPRRGPGTRTPTPTTPHRARSPAASSSTPDSGQWCAPTCRAGGPSDRPARPRPSPTTSCSSGEPPRIGATDATQGHRTPTDRRRREGHPAGIPRLPAERDRGQGCGRARTAGPHRRGAVRDQSPGVGQASDARRALLLPRRTDRRQRPRRPARCLRVLESRASTRAPDGS
jgi:hypothetical protein